MQSSENILNHKNYWDIAYKIQAQISFRHWKEHSWINLLSLAWSILKRLAVGYFIIPPFILFLVLFLESNSSGLVVTLNTVFSTLAANPVNDDVAASVTKLWHFMSLFFFLLTWIIPWSSPATRYAEREMTKWHRINGDKMLPPQHDS